MWQEAQLWAVPQLATLEVENPAAWKQQVRQVRIRAPDEDPSACGVNTKTGRKTAIAAMYNTELTQGARVGEGLKFLYLDHGEYISFMKYKKGLTREEAERPLAQT